MTLEERLNVMGIDATNGDCAEGEYLNQGQIPKTDNLLVLLVQGLQSNDAKMLNVSYYFIVLFPFFQFLSIRFFIKIVILYLLISG